MTYNANGGTPIEGLTDGAIYNVVVIDGNTIQLTQVPFLNLAPPPETDGQMQFSLNAIDAGTDTIYAPDHGFSEGDQVVYWNLSGGDEITGLSDGYSYIVHVIDDDNFQLRYVLEPTTVQISQGTATGNHGFEMPTGVADVILNLASIDAGQDIVTLANHGLLDGETIGYEGSGESLIAGMASGQSYVVHVIDANNFQLATSAANAQNGIFADLSTSATPSVQSLGCDMQSFDAQAGVPFALNAIDAASDTIWIPAHGFTSGRQIVYTAPSGGAAITGLVSGATYTVNVVDEANFQLVDGSGTVIQISQGQAIGEHSFVDAATDAGWAINLAAINVAQNR